jgi:hypothetical protein
MPESAPYAPKGPAAFSRSLLAVFDDEQLSDGCFYFLCGRKIHVQKAILAASNEYFRASKSHTLTRLGLTIVAVFDENSTFLEGSAPRAASASAQTLDRVGQPFTFVHAALDAKTALFDGDSDVSDDEGDAPGQGNAVVKSEGDDGEAPPAKRQRLSSATEIKIVDFS